MQSKAATVPAYLASLPADRRATVEAVRNVILANLDKGFQEGMSYGMIGYCVPHTIYPAGYHCDPKTPLPYAGIGAQKNHIGLYLFCLYNDAGDMQTFISEWKATGKKLDMGKACIRFKDLSGVPLDVVGRAIKRASLKNFIAHYEKNILSMNKAAAERAAARNQAAGGKAGKAVNAKTAKTSKKTTAKKSSKRKTVKNATAKSR